MRKAIFSAVLLASTVIAGANAATINYEGTDNGMNLVSIDGEIVSGDADQFKQLTAALTGRTIVVLNSPGGRLTDGLTIGAVIHSSGFATVVDAHKLCASVCGLIWLAGSPRLLTTGSEIGFHAAYEPDGSESGEGNAIVGAYLTDLGFAIPAIIYMTQSAPHEMTWLHPNDARQFGITFTMMPPPPQEDSQAFMPSTPPPSVPASPPATVVAVAPPWSPPVAVARIGPSFDCARADTEVTKFICSDAELSLVDLLLVQPVLCAAAGSRPARLEAIDGRGHSVPASRPTGLWHRSGGQPADRPAGGQSLHDPDVHCATLSMDGPVVRRRLAGGHATHSATHRLAGSLAVAGLSAGDSAARRDLWHRDPIGDHELAGIGRPACHWIAGGCRCGTTDARGYIGVKSLVVMA